MADPNEKNKANASAANPADLPDSQLDKLEIKDDLNDEELDQFLQAQDPEFFKAVEQMSSDKSLTMKQIVINDDDAAFNEEVDYWRSRVGLLKVLYKLNPFMPHISLRLKKLKVKLVDSAQVAWIHAKNFTYYVAVDGRKIAVEKIKVQIKIFADNLAKNKTNFKKLSWKLKLAFVGIFVLILLTPALIYLSVTNRLVPPEPELFLNSVESVAGEKSEYDPAEGMEGFYDNLRASQNMILIQKMVLNIKTSKSSGPNPMVAMEFFIEGVNSDVVVEIKDREVMMRDLMMRTIEDFDFDTLESGDGKKELVARLQKELNAILTTGRIKNIRIKTFIVKP